MSRSPKSSHSSAYDRFSISHDLSFSALSRSASALLGDGKEAQALLAWLDIQERDWLDSSSLSALDPTITAKDVVGNVEMLLALEEDTAAADRIWSGNGVLDVAELAVG